MTNDTTYRNAALFEHRFWLFIMGDHARMIYGALAANEQNEIQRAQAFMNDFYSMLNYARRNLSDGEIAALNQKAYQSVQELKAYTLHLLNRQLVGNLSSNLSPTGYSHMVNELEEYVIVLQALLAMQIPPLLHDIHYHLVWLSDAYGHAGAIVDHLDLTEENLRINSSKYVQLFKDFYLKAADLAGYLRTNLRHFPALSRFNQQVDLEMRLFMKFLNELKELGMANKLLWTLGPFVVDHMAREECYYLIKLSQISDIERPECDPTQ